jgi:hypothetical protein
LKHKLYSISEKSLEKLIIRKRKGRNIQALVFICLFLAFWMFGNFSLENQDDKRDITQQFLFLLTQPAYWIFCFAVPGLLLYQIGTLVYLLIVGEKIILDKVTRQILKNNTARMNLQKVSHLQIRKYNDSDGDTDYRLSIVQVGQEKMFIDRSSDEDGIIEFAEEVADSLGKEIKFK